MTLGELIAELEKLPPTAVVGLGNAHSYRGYYNDLAFEPKEGATAAELLAEARSCIGRTFTGYKGGEYVMEEYTDCWCSPWGMASQEALTAHRFINIREKHELHGLIRELVRMHGADAVHDAVVGATEGER